MPACQQHAENIEGGNVARLQHQQRLEAPFRVIEPPGAKRIDGLLEKVIIEAAICQLNSAAASNEAAIFVQLRSILSFRSSWGSCSIRKWYSITFVVSRRGKFNAAICKARRIASVCW